MLDDQESRKIFDKNDVRYVEEQKYSNLSTSDTSRYYEDDDFQPKILKSHKKIESVELTTFEEHDNGIGQTCSFCNKLSISTCERENINILKSDCLGCGKSFCFDHGVQV